MGLSFTIEIDEDYWNGTHERTVSFRMKHTRLISGGIFRERKMPSQQVHDMWHNEERLLRKWHIHT